MWLSVMLYHKGAKPWLEFGMVVFPQPHFLCPLEKWVSSTAYTNFVEVCRNAGTLFFVINAWHHRRLHSSGTLHANDQLAKNTFIGDCQITHTISCIITNEWSAIKSHFFSIVFWFNPRGLVTSNKFQLAKNSCLTVYTIRHAASTCHWQNMPSSTWLLLCGISYWLKQTVQK